MKKLVIFTVLMLSVSMANAGFVTKSQSSYKQQPNMLSFKKQPSITLPPPAPVPAPQKTQEVTVKNEYVQAIEDHEEGGYKEQKEGNVGAVPVPAALPLMASALCIFGIARRRSINK